MVAGDEQLELGEEVEEVLSHEARRYLVPAGDGLDLRFVPAPALFCFDRCNKACTAQACEVGGVPVRACFHKRVHWSVSSVITEDGGNRRHEDRLSVGPGAVEKEQGVLAGDPGQAVADHALQVIHQFGIATGDIRQEASPGGALAPGSCGGHLGHAVGALVCTHPTGA